MAADGRLRCVHVTTMSNISPNLYTLRFSQLKMFALLRIAAAATTSPAEMRISVDSLSFEGKQVNQHLNPWRINERFLIESVAYKNLVLYYRVYGYCGVAYIFNTLRLDGLQLNFQDGRGNKSSYL